MVRIYKSQEINPEIAHKRIDSILEEAEKHGIDLGRNYKRESRGYNLQVELDHVGRDLKFVFIDNQAAQRNEKVYKSYINIFDRVIKIQPEGFWRDHMIEQKRNLRKYRDLALRVNEIVL